MDVEPKGGRDEWRPLRWTLHLLMWAVILMAVSSILRVVLLVQGCP